MQGAGVQSFKGIGRDGGGGEETAKDSFPEISYKPLSSGIVDEIT